MNLVEYDQFSVGEEASIGFLRQAEIKHGRVAMAAFVGYIVQANGFHFPYFLGATTSGATPEDQWFNLPMAGRAQIIAFIGCLEWWGEFGGTHYMKGGKPGTYPSFDQFRENVHPLPFDLYDPFGIAAKNS